MAKATRLPVDDFQVVLTLSKEEAELVHAMHAKICGCGKLNRMTGDIYHVLNDILKIRARNPYTIKNDSIYIGEDYNG